MKCNFLVFFCFLPFVSFAQIKNETQLISDQSSKSSQFNTWETSKIIKKSDRSSGSVSPSLVPASIKNEASLSPEEKLKAQGAKEDVSKRDANSKHFMNLDGTYTAIITAGPVHYLNNGSWEDIKTEIIPTNNSSYPYINKTNLLESHFGKKVSDGVISKTEAGQVKEFLNTKMYWEVNGQISGLKYGVNVNAQKEGDKVFYRNIYGDIDAEFTVLVGKRKLNYIIPNKESLGEIPIGAELLVFSEEIQIPQGWTYKINEKKDVEIKDNFGKTVLIYARPFVMEDYQGSTGLEETDESISFFEVSQEENLLKILTKVKTTWLLNEQRVFPIAVDPTVYPNNTDGTGHARSNGGGGDNEIRVGRTGNAGNNFPTLGYAKFNLSTIPDDSYLLSVTSRFFYIGRQGELNSGQNFAIVDAPIDPVTSTYINIYNSPTQYISSDYHIWWTNPSPNVWYENEFSENGLSYVQDSFDQNFVTIGLWPLDFAFWNNYRYARFQGYSNNNRPQLVINYTTTCTAPSSSSNTYYISNVKFVGTLNPDTNRSSGYTTGGYANYTSDVQKGKQIPGGVVNINMTSTGGNIFTKAWVDWNQNGIYDSSEKIYDSGFIYVPSTTFGFVVPVGTAPGFYTVRIRTNRETPYYRACGPMGNGETEDYSFEVIADCPAKITAVNIDPSHGHRCGPGAVTISASGTGTSYRWYTTEFGGTAIPLATSDTYTTPSISTTTTYYVTAYNGSCESVKRIPVVAKIDPIPAIDFTVSEPDICGTDASLLVTSSGDQEEHTLLMEEFNAGLGAFQHQYAGNTDPNAAWMNQPSPFKPGTPPYYVFSPAIASGYSGGNFACAVTDVQQTSNILNRLETINTYDASELLTLNVDFDLYYASFGTLNPLYEYFAVEASADGGANWQTITTIITSQGNPSSWSKQSISLSSTYLVPNFKIRFVIFAYGANNGWVGDAAGIDNVRIYGDRPLDSNFNWAGDAGIIYNENCIDPYTGAAPTVCIKPTDFESNETWAITATAILSNGCSASGNVEIENNNKVWNTGASNWATLNWKPGTGVPTADNCVIIRTPVFIPNLTDGLAKNLKVETGGSLTIQSGGALTLTDYLNNEATPSAFVVESDANLLQIGPGAVNTGEITVKRSATVPSNQYNYWASPVIDQDLYGLYDDIPNNRVMTYNTTTDYFNIVPAGTLSSFGIGYSIKGPTSNWPLNPSGGTGVVAEFIGVPQNESLTSGENHIVVTTFDNGDNFNLIGNPFPSNMNLDLLYDEGNVDGTGNEVKFKTADVYFWDNIGNTEMYQQGSGYNQSNYAIYNLVDKMGTPAPCGPPTCTTGSGKKPNGIVKPGQGFIVNIAEGATYLTVSNTMRTIETLKGGDEAVYYKNGILPEANDTHKRDDKFWLEMINPGSVHIQTAVGYFETAEDTFEIHDTKILSETVSDNIYTLSKDAVKLAIQGREGVFNNEDVIPLGVKAFVTGKYKIQLEETKGIFVSYQDIYLKDKLRNVIHNLSDEGAYEFEAAEGVDNHRFEIIFKDRNTETGPVLTASSQIQIQKVNHHIQITSSKDKLMEVEIFNLAGRSVYKNTSINAKEFRIPIKSFENQIIVVKVQTETGEIVTKKLVN